MPKNYRLTQQELDDLQFEHRHTSNKRYADRIKTVYLLGTGWSVTQVAEALMIDRETVRNHYKRYRKGGLPALLKHDAGGSEASLNDEQLQQLSQHLQENLYQTAKEIALENGFQYLPPINVEFASQKIFMCNNIKMIVGS